MVVLRAEGVSLACLFQGYAAGVPPAARQSRRNDDGGRSYSSSSQRASFLPVCPQTVFSLINCFLSFSEMEVHLPKVVGWGTRG